MNINNFSIRNCTKVSDARDMLFNEAQSHCKLIKGQVELVKLVSGIALKLYNKGLRPTVYHVDIKFDSYGFASSLVLDTIIAENKSHRCFKTSFSTGVAYHITNLLAELSSQPCDGNIDDTLLEYKPIGLLYSKKKVDNT